MNYMGRTRYRLAAVILVSVALLAFLANTSPKSLPIEWLLFPFICLYFGIYLFSSVIHGLLSGRVKSNKKINKYIAAFSLIIVLLLLFNSVNRLSVRDVLIITFGTMIFVFYISKSSSNKEIRRDKKPGP